jgi:hypothetical protein
VPISPQAAYFPAFHADKAQANFTAPQSPIINKGDVKVDATVTKMTI